jgi:hypothetical protein
MRTENQGRYQMLWDCPFCGAEKLLGLEHRHCPGCGSPQDPARRYFPDDDNKIAVEDHPYHGADLVCSACEAPNAAKAEFCVTCGAPLTEGAKAVRLRQTQSAAEGAAHAADSAKAATAEHKAAKAPKPPPEPAPSGGIPWKMIGCGALVMGLIAVLLVVLLWKKEDAFTVAGHRWERTIAVEKNAVVKEEAWQDEVPRGATDLSCREKDRGTKKVEDGEECQTKRVDKGDGTFDQVKECHTKYRDVATQDQWCRYSVEKWTVDRTEKAAGKGLDDKPTWPDAGIRQEGSCLGCEREGKRSETYTVLLTSAGDQKEHRCDLPQKTWSGMAKGARYQGAVGVVTGAIDCDALKAVK